MLPPAPLVAPAQAPSLPSAGASPSRQVVAAVLRHVSRVLDRAAQRLLVPAMAPPPRPVEREFAQVDGRGALYEDGRLVGWLEGVDRL